MKLRKKAKITGIILLAGMLCGCSSTYSTSEEKYVVGVVTKSDSSEYWMSVNSGMEDAAVKYNMEVIAWAPDSELDKEVQEKQVEKLIEQNVDALAVSPIDSYQIPDYMETLEEKGMSIITFDTGFEGISVPYIGIDNHKAGYELAQELAEAMNHRGQVGIVSGDLNQMGHRERVEGFKEYMETEPDMTVEFTESGYGNLQMSEEKVRALMEKYPEVKGIMATSAVTALGLADELSEDGIQIVTVDAQEDSLQALEQGKLLAVAAQSGYEIGYETIHYIDRLRKGEEEDSDYLDAEILTQEDVKEGGVSYESTEYSQ